MKIGLLGYGKMGRTIEKLTKTDAGFRQHEIALKSDIEMHSSLSAKSIKECDVVIEFTQPDAAVENILLCLDAGVPVVSGTTGWLQDWNVVKNHCNKAEGALFYAPNFSIGVNLFFALNARLALWMKTYPEYEAKINETHHIHKKDAPSGTAIKLAEDIIRESNLKTKWVSGEIVHRDELSIVSIREGEVPGTHQIIYGSDTDSISIEHKANSREGFAKGALMAAEFLQHRKGIFGMDDLLKLT